MTAVLSALALMLLATVSLSATAGAQEGVPEGTTCFRIDAESPVSVFFMPGDYDLAILVLDDGSEVPIGSVTTGQRVEAPEGRLIVAAFKCEFPVGEEGGEATPTPEPTPEATPEPTPEATPEPTPEATPEPTPEPTPEATPEPTEEVVVVPPSTPTPEAEVLPKVQEEGELAVTGTNTTALLIIVGASLIMGGAMVSRRRIAPQR